MKKVKLIIALVFVGIGLNLSAQDCKADWNSFIEKQTAEFISEEDSPLTEADRPRFKSLDYYDYNNDYCVEARFERLLDEKPFEMVTSTERRPVYIKYANLHFEIAGEKLVLALYQNQKLVDSEAYGDYLFLPFGDDTNGIDTYGAGRFIDMRIPDSDVVQLDFNQSYNPLCAYNHDYSCPRPPDENMLKVKIEAGVKGVNLKE